jgi:hypothetical protein
MLPVIKKREDLIILGIALLVFVASALSVCDQDHGHKSLARRVQDTLL